MFFFLNKDISNISKKNKICFLSRTITLEHTPKPQSEISNKKKAKIGKSFLSNVSSKKVFFSFFHRRSRKDT